LARRGPEGPGRIAALGESQESESNGARRNWGYAPFGGPRRACGLPVSVAVGELSSGRNQGDCGCLGKEETGNGVSWGGARDITGRAAASPWGKRAATHLVPAPLGPKSYPQRRSELRTGNFSWAHVVLAGGYGGRRGGIVFYWLGGEGGKGGGRHPLWVFIVEGHGGAIFKQAAVNLPAKRMEGLGKPRKQCLRREGAQKRGRKSIREGGGAGEGTGWKSVALGEGEGRRARVELHSKKGWDRRGAEGAVSDVGGPNKKGPQPREPRVPRRVSS